MTAKERLEKVNYFLGYGNLETAKVIFIAIEEHGVTEDLDDYNNWDKKNISFKQLFYYHKFEKSKAKGITNIRQGKLVHKLLSKLFRIPSLPNTEDFLSGNINDDFTFYSNLYPLGCDSENSPYPDQYFDLFGIGNILEDKRNYQIDVSEIRKKLLKNLILYKLNDDSQSLFFIMGDSPKQIILNICQDLGLTFPEEFSFPRPENNNDIIYNSVKQNQLLKWHCSDNKRVWFTGHASNGWFDERVAERIVEFLKENK